MQDKELEHIDLETNPQRIILVDKADTKERLEKLEKKFNRWNKIEKASSVFAGISTMSGVAVFLEEGIRETIKFGFKDAGVTTVCLAGIFLGATLSATGLVAQTVANKQKNKIEKDLQKVRETLALREKAKNNPNMVVEEKSEKQIQLEQKLKKYNPEKIETVGSITSTIVGGVGALGGGAVGGLFGAAYTGLISGGLCYLPFAISEKIAQRRQDKLNKQLKETIKTEHPDFYRQELLAEMNKFSETATQELQTQEQKLAQIDVATKLAKNCDSTEIIEKLVDSVKNSDKNNTQLDKLVLNNGKGIV